MKFTLKCVKKTGARRGVMSGIERLPGFEMETPNVLLYTQVSAQLLKPFTYSFR